MWIEILIAIATLLIMFFYWSTSTFNYWKSRNIPGPKPLPLVGNYKDWLLGRQSNMEVVDKIYKQHRNDPVVGVFMGREPYIIVVDLDLVRDVLVKDFAAFSDRGLGVFEKSDPMTQNLLNLEFPEWRPLRQQITPAFTPARLKNMFYLVLECGKHLEKHLENLGDKRECINCFDLTSKYTMDVIASCVFGLQINACEDENCELRKIGLDLVNPNWKNAIRLMVRDSVPWLYWITTLIHKSKSAPFFADMFKNTIEFRKNNHIVRDDFIDVLMDLRDHPEKISDIELTDELLAAQLFIFFLAGYDTSSTAMSHLLYELALSHPIQDKVRNDIKSAIEKNDGELSFEAIRSMKYLDMVFKETLRKYPPAVNLRRRSVKPYTFSGTNFTIPEDLRIIIPIYSIHWDPIHYPNPEVFDPERFTEEASKDRHPMAWIPFGEGPRNCVGMRFANYQNKVGLITILLNYKVEVCDKTRIPYAIHPLGDLVTPLDGIHLKLSKIDQEDI